MYLEVVDEGRQLRGRFPWGVLLVTDDVSSEPIPDWAGNDAQVTRSRTAVVIKVLHEIDGAATVRLLRERSSTERVVICDATIDVPSGKLRVSNATADQAMTVDVAPGPVSLRICGDRARDPTSVDIVLLPGIPSSAEALQQLMEVATNGYSAPARRKASEWATPILMANPMLDPLSPEYEGIFLLSVADTPADLKDPKGYVYGPADFDQAIQRLTDDTAAG
jgi:hypothetical protein